MSSKLAGTIQMKKYSKHVLTIKRCNGRYGKIQ